MKTGIFPGKFLPPHKGHLRTIIEAASKCDLLYVLICENNSRDEALCRKNGLKYISGLLRFEWFSRELQGIGNIKVVLVDDNEVEQEPFDFETWSRIVRSVVKEDLAYIFSSEIIYEDFNKKYFPEAESVIIDYEREKVNISATKIRENPYKHWNYIPKSARGFFVKKVLITGTESCGKTTLTKYLGAWYNTTFAEEVGRHYPGRFLGGENNDVCFKDSDFGRITAIHYENINNAAETADKVMFIDTDAVNIQYWSEVYMGRKNKVVEGYINPEDFDLVFLMAPTVPWVDDGTRFLGEQEKRIKMHEKMKKMYLENGFGDRLVEITNGNFSKRLSQVTARIDELLAGK